MVQVPRCHFGEPIQKINDISHYFPISNNEINSIEIDIKDDTGKEIQFNQERVVVGLHFRENELI